MNFLEWSESDFRSVGMSYASDKLLDIMGRLSIEEQALVRMYVDMKYYDNEADSDEAMKYYDNEAMNNIKGIFEDLNATLGLDHDWDSVIPYEKHFYKKLITLLNVILQTALKMQDAVKMDKSINLLSSTEFSDILVFGVIPFFAVECSIHKYTVTFIQKYRKYLELIEKKIYYRDINELAEQDNFVKRLVNFAEESFYSVYKKADTGIFAKKSNAFIKS